MLRAPSGGGMQLLINYLRQPLCGVRSEATIKSIGFYARTALLLREYIIQHCAINPTTKITNQTSNVCNTKGDKGASASGCDGGTRVNVSFVPGINDKRKLKESPNTERYGRSLPRKVSLVMNAPPKAARRTTIPSACPAFRPPVLDNPNEVITANNEPMR